MDRYIRRDPPPKPPDVASVDRYMPRDRTQDTTSGGTEGGTSADSTGVDGTGADGGQGNASDAGPTFGGALVAISDKVPTDEVHGSFNDGTSIYCINVGPNGVFGAVPSGPEMQCRRVLNTTTSEEAYRMYTSFALISSREDDVARLQIRPTSKSQLSQP